jgi:hypothetical protein
MGWKAMLLEETDQARVWLRRHHQGCVAGSYCNAMTHLEDGPWNKIGDYSGIGDTPFKLEDFPADDPRWPTQCEKCGQPFAPEAAYQLFYRPLYRRPDTGALLTLDNLETGMMWGAWWMRDAMVSEFYKRDWADKRPPLYMAMPGGVSEWFMDGIASNGPGWEITGEYPHKLTARPSIGKTDDKGNWLYHGWLTDGILSSDIDGRVFPSSPNTA